MENYIVRVLRRDTGQGGRDVHLDGVVEIVESGKRHAFHTADELWAILGEEIINMDDQVATLDLSSSEETSQYED